MAKKTITENKQDLNTYLKNIGLLNGVDEKINKKKVSEWIEDGSWQEDLNWTVANNPLCSHFYEPISNLSGLSGVCASAPSAYDWTNKENNLWSWKAARDYLYTGLTTTANAYGQSLRDVFLSHAFKALGHSVHLVQDVSVPAHTRGDLHADIFPFSTTVGREPYEDFTKINVGRLLTHTTVPFPYWNVSISTLAPRQFWDLDTYTGGTPYTSGYIGLSEYTNANFFSEDTIFKNYPHPAKANTTAALVEQYAKDGKKDTVHYIQGYTSQRLAAYSYLNKWLSPDRWEYNLDDFVYEGYASQLIPRAVGYSAGLLDYFFRGTLEITAPDSYVYSIADGSQKSPAIHTYQGKGEEHNAERERC